MSPPPAPRRLVLAPCPTEAVARLEAELGVSHVVAQVLVRRGLGDPGEARTWLGGAARRGAGGGARARRRRRGGARPARARRSGGGADGAGGRRRARRRRVLRHRRG